VPVQRYFVSLIIVETLIASDHPLRVIKRMLDEVLRGMSAHFDKIYAGEGAPSIPPETLLKIKVLHALYTVQRPRHHIADLFFSEVVELARRHGWVSDEPFSVDATLIEAWACTRRRNACSRRATWCAWRKCGAATASRGAGRRPACCEI
jgi:transposase